MKKELYQETDTPQYIIIRSLGMANYLVRCGHDIKKVDNSEIDERFKVFLFHDSNKLRHDMAKFSK